MNANAIISFSMFNAYFITQKKVCFIFGFKIRDFAVLISSFLVGIVRTLLHMLIGSSVETSTFWHKHARTIWWTKSDILWISSNTSSLNKKPQSQPHFLWQEISSWDKSASKPFTQFTTYRVHKLTSFNKNMNSHLQNSPGKLLAFTELE